MSTYSIKDLEQLSGIKAHTLRIWEQRYQLITPKRTETNIRFYDDDDLKLILNIALLRDNDHKISKIASMTQAEMHEEILRLTEKTLRYPDQIHVLTLSMINLDEVRFEKIVANNVHKLGFESTMINIIYPFLSKIGVLWQTGSINPAQEHFVANLIRQKLIVAIDSIPITPYPDAHKYLLYLPEGELHEITLLFIHYLIRIRENRVLYFGQNLPFNDLQSIYDIHHPDFIVTVITTSPPTHEVQEYVDKLAKSFPEATILLSGYQVVGQDIHLPYHVRIFTGIEQITDFIEEHHLVKSA